MARNFETANEAWDNIMGEAVRALLCLENEAGALLWFRHCYIELLEERDAYAEEHDIPWYSLKINAGMVAKRMLQHKLDEDYKGRCSPMQSWSRV